MAADRNRDLIDRFYGEMWNRFDTSQIPMLLTEDIRFRGSLGQEKSGWREFEDYVRFIQSAFPDFLNEVIEVVSEGDRAFARLLYSGTHGGRSSGWPRPGASSATRVRHDSGFADRASRTCGCWATFTA